MNELTEDNIKNGLKGSEIVKSFVKILPETPGVYRMIGDKGEVLYVGKAKALKKRVNSYIQTGNLSYRIRRMVESTMAMEFVVTQTEAEALLLEANLIKKLKPRFNILLRDDKSFPYIHLTADHEYPMVRKHRGVKKRKGEYFGPFAGAGEVNRTLAILQRVFMLRNCSDNVFANRERPCLQYHIKRCTAPCVDYVSKEDYAKQVEQAADFLRGKSRDLQERFVAEMRVASEEMDYERAAFLRDRIKALTSIQARQDIHFDGIKNADVITVVQKDGQSCVQMFFFRNGANFGNRSYFPAHATEESRENILLAVMGQFYQNKTPPREIVVNIEIENAERVVLEQALGEAARLNEGLSYPVKITSPKGGKRQRMVEFVEKNAAQALDRHIAQRQSEGKLLEKVGQLFELEEVPQRIEVYDNSHISGTNMVGAMIVAGPEGFEKNSYRKFNIKTAAQSDDYGMMDEVLRRRFRGVLKEDFDSEGLPDLVLIDGGLGQLSAARAVFADLAIDGIVKLVAIAKGEDRNAGREKFFTDGKDMFQLPVNDPVLHYLQRLRDEAHRFAIGAHRTKRAKQTRQSTLDDVAGIGASRKKALLHHFGSAKAVAGAGVEDLLKVEGISRAMAQKIYDFFH